MTSVDATYSASYLQDRDFVQRMHKAVTGLTHFAGILTIKLPTDLWAIQELIMSQRPEWIVETGSFRGGSALFYASLLDFIGVGEVISIDHGVVEAHHPRVHFIRSKCEDAFGAVRAMVKRSRKVMVLLDCNHTREHVLQELDTFGLLTSPGQSLIVEDTTFHDADHQSCEAVAEWLPKHPDFSLDREAEKYVLTYNHGGFLRRREK